MVRLANASLNAPAKYSKCEIVRVYSNRSIWKGLLYGVTIEYCLFRILLLQCTICLLVILLVLALGQGRLFNCKL